MLSQSDFERSLFAVLSTACLKVLEVMVYKNEPNKALHLTPTSNASEHSIKTKNLAKRKFNEAFEFQGVGEEGFEPPTPSV